MLFPSDVTKMRTNSDSSMQLSTALTETLLHKSNITPRCYMWETHGKRIQQPEISI